MNPWTDILNAAELEAFHLKTQQIDPRFAREEQAFYKARTANALRSLKASAWTSNCSTAYMLARSYLALAEAREAGR